MPSVEDQVLAAFGTLAPRSQQVLRAVAGDGRPLLELADELQMPATSVAALAQRGRAELRDAVLAGARASSPAGCRPHRARLGGYVDGTLAARDRRVVEDHLAVCEGCHALVEALRNDITTLRRALAAGGAPVFAAPGHDPDAPVRVDADHDDRERGPRRLVAALGSTRAMFGLIAAAVIVVAAGTAGVASVLDGDGDGDGDVLATVETTTTGDSGSEDGSPTTLDLPGIDLPDGRSTPAIGGGSESAGSDGSSAGTGGDVGIPVTTTSTFRPGNIDSPAPTTTTTTGGSTATTTPSTTTTTVAPTTTTTTPSADLSVTRSVSGAGGSTFTLRVVLTNAGPSTATSPSVNVRRTAGSNPNLAGEAAGWTCTAPGSNVTCTGVSLAPGASVEVTFTVTNMSLLQSGTLGISGSSAVTDPDLSDNSTSYTWAY